VANGKTPSGTYDASTFTELDRDGIIRSIHRKYHTRLQRYLERRLSSGADVADVSQDVYLRLIRHPRLGELEPSLALLCTIAANLIKDRFRRQNVRSDHAHISLDDVQIESQTPSPEEMVRSKEGVDAIRSVFSALNKDTRRVFALHRFEDHTYAEIAKIMGISKSMVQKHISQALFQLGKKFEKIK
jgi:RNA polymerase sigma factor (sigma-70 family)